VVSPHYQDKHERQGGGEAQSGGKVAAFVPPVVLLGFTGDPALGETVV
jgi:hypothetical protein